VKVLIADAMADQWTLKIGDRITIPKDQYGLPIRKFNPKTKKYIDDELQVFEVTSMADNRIDLKPVWLTD